MSPEEIKAEKERCYQLIKDGSDGLKEIRRVCPHGKTFVGRWEWRMGASYWTHICDYCGVPVDHPENKELLNKPLYDGHEPYSIRRLRSTNPEQEP